MPNKVTASNKVAETPNSIEELLEQQSKQSLLRFISCGSVDDGKSTLIGRMIWESQQLFDDQLAALQADSKRFGTQGGEIDFALLVDGLAAEREQGITIDVAYRFFATAKRKFIVADTPGHEQYTRNMVTGASTADVAVLLVDARQGLQTQTRRHAFLVALMGIRHVVLAINKMDLVDYAPSRFEQIRDAFASYAQALDFAAITAIPISALKGENIITRSPRTAWYKGPSLMGYLETVQPEREKMDVPAFPIQWVNRPHADFRGFSGTVAGGEFSVDDEIRITASGQTARIRAIVTMEGAQEQARKAQAVTLCLDREIDASRGDIITPSNTPLETSEQFEATLIWMHQEPGLIGRTYNLKLASQWAIAALTDLKYRINPNTLAHEAAKTLQLNDICVCNVTINKPLAFATYERSSELGGFILVDRFTNATLGAGLIRHNLRRAQNVHRQALTIGRLDRERLNGHKGKVIWFTGLPSSGKSTLANALEVALHERGMRTYLLDGDNVRHGLNRDLGFTDADRVENIRRVAEVAKLMMDAGLVVMTAFISPFQREREMARELIGTDNFVEVFVDAPVELCEQRDVKGLYKKARAGKLPNLTGVGSPYEPPLTPEFTAETGISDVRAIISQLITRLEQ